MSRTDHPPPWRWVAGAFYDANGTRIIWAEGSKVYALDGVRRLTELAPNLERFRELEWSGHYATDVGDSCCPCCSADADEGRNPGHRHEPDCWLAAVLAEIDKAKRVGG